MPKDIVSDRIKIDNNNLPKHIAIIMDGNGRWAQRKGMARTNGHVAGAEALRKTVRNCMEIGVPILTVYAFSTENWKRPSEEVNFLMNLLVRQVKAELQEILDNSIKIQVFGDVDRLPLLARQAVKYACEKSAGNDRFLLNIALNYGGRAEITRAFKLLFDELTANDGDSADIDEQMIGDHLYTAGLPDPDLLIRTGGNMRISNYLLWQLAYTEIWITEKYWPDFNKEDLLQAISDYQSRDRRYGGFNTAE